MTMRLASAALALLVVAVAVVSAQATHGVLRITVTLKDAATQAATPVRRHVLLVSDEPPSAAPRAIPTAADGTVMLTLRPGSYIVESDQPVLFGGRAYQWRQEVQIVAGRDVRLDFTADNADILSSDMARATTDALPGALPGEDGVFETLFDKHQASVVAVWSPTARVSGFVVDARGLIATVGDAIGTATAVEVQLSPTVKVPGDVLYSERGRDVAIVRVDPSVLATRPPIELACPPSRTPTVEDRQTIATIAMPHDAEKEFVRGDVIALQPRRVDTNVRLSFGGSGGPVFNDAGAVVGLTSTPADPDARWRDAVVVPTIFICEALAGSLRALSTSAQPPSATQLPVEPTRPFPAGALEAAPKGTTPNAAVPILSSSDFDVAFITPPMIHRARQRSGWTGGQTGRTPEAEARIGRLTEFSAWSDYFASLPPVLIVRVTPKMVESFWKRLGREAARTQGANLPAFKDFKSSFLQMRASCGGVDVTPIHPFVLEHNVSEKKVIREGLYVFDPEAFGPQCAAVTLSLFSEAQPTRADSLAVTRAVLDRVWVDFAPHRATGGK
jgi:S1-C subfamily serine protease